MSWIRYYVFVKLWDAISNSCTYFNCGLTKTLNDQNQIKLYWCNYIPMMTSSNRNIFRVTDPLWGESISHRCFLWSEPEQRTEQTIETQLLWDAIALIMTSLYCISWSHLITVSKRGPIQKKKLIIQIIPFIPPLVIPRIRLPTAVCNNKRTLISYKGDSKKPCTFSLSLRSRYFQWKDDSSVSNSRWGNGICSE